MIPGIVIIWNQISASQIYIRVAYKKSIYYCVVVFWTWKNSFPSCVYFCVYSVFHLGRYCQKNALKSGGLGKKIKWGWPYWEVYRSCVCVCPNFLHTMWGPFCSYSCFWLLWLFHAVHLIVRLIIPSLCKFSAVNVQRCWKIIWELKKRVNLFCLDSAIKVCRKHLLLVIFPPQNPFKKQSTGLQI